MFEKWLNWLTLHPEGPGDHQGGRRPGPGGGPGAVAGGGEEGGGGGGGGVQEGGGAEHHPLQVVPTGLQECQQERQDCREASRSWKER